MDKTIHSANTTTSEDIKTSREVLAANTEPKIDDDNEDDESDLPTISSPTITSDDSRSSADISSELLADEQDDEQLANQVPTTRQINMVHNHLLPSGWSCNYNPISDEYSFEYTDGIGKETSKQTEVYRPFFEVNMLDRGINVRTPTRDETVQTSRRPTLKLSQCPYGYHFPTSPTSSMISDLAKQVQKTATSASTATRPNALKARQIGYGKHKLVVPDEEEEQVKRLHDMFPTAPKPIIEQMIRIYHGREGLIKAALISLGYKRSSEYNVQQATAQSPIMLMMSKASSKKLFDKLVGYFPDTDENLIKNLMYKHKEIEHEIISALVESGDDGSRSKSARVRLDSAMKADRNGAIMKLRYLKFLYPTCEEIELYHLLNCNDLNAQVVMELVEKNGHKRINIEEVMQNRKSHTQQVRAQQAAHAAQDKVTSNAADLIQAHAKRTKPNVTDVRIAGLRANIKKSLEQVDDNLIDGALEAADYNEALAKQFLTEMEPVDEIAFKQRYELPHPTEPDVISFPCKATQMDGTTFYMTIILNENLYLPREVVECQHALALLKVDASTFTQEDFPKQKFSHRLGCRIGLATGSNYKRKSAHSKENLNRGPRTSLRIGAKYEEICQEADRVKPSTRARGHNESVAKGRNVILSRGHNTKLLQRTHPFFQDA